MHNETRTYDTMQYVKTSVRTVCVGQAASAAAVLLAAWRPRRTAPPRAQLQVPCEIVQRVLNAAGV
jgi:ATP-dependent Clp protease protease subunit